MNVLSTSTSVQKKPADLKEWHIAYTFPKAERKAYKKLETMGITSFLPLHRVIRNWSDRKKKLEVPIFPNYIFIYTSSQERYEILQLKELVRYVTFEGKPAVVSESLITSLRTMLKGNVEVCHEEYQAGSQVKVIDGPFIGSEGILIRKNGESRLLIQFEVLQRTVSVNISSSAVSPV